MIRSPKFLHEYLLKLEQSKAFAKMLPLRNDKDDTVAEKNKDQAILL